MRIFVLLYTCFLGKHMHKLSFSHSCRLTCVNCSYCIFRSISRTFNQHIRLFLTCDLHCGCTKGGGVTISFMHVHTLVYYRAYIIISSLAIGTRRSSCTAAFKLKVYLKEMAHIPFLNISRSLGDYWSLSEHTQQFVISP